MSIHIISRGMKAIKISNILLKHSTTLISACGCKQNCYTTKSTNIMNIDEMTNVEQQKKKTSIIPKITLISGNDLSITTLEEAQRLSKRRDLKLVKIVDLDTKTQRPIYKLMTGSEYYAEELKQRELKKKEKQANTVKKEKLLILGSNISEHDLGTNIRKIDKWITKAYEVRVVINMEKNADKAEKVYNLLEDALKATARFVQKRQKGSDIRFQILPPKKNKNDDDKSL